MKEYREYDILITRVENSDGKTAKYRPVVVIKVNNEIVRTFNVTSQYARKSDWIKSKYLEIIDWSKAKLIKPSWIDTVRYYDYDKDTFVYKVLGRLTDNDIERLIDFIGEDLK